MRGQQKHDKGRDFCHGWSQEVCTPHQSPFFTFAELRHDSFPLFSKGVDTYRFEYGVFLLNKDIEMVRACCGSKLAVVNVD